MRNILIAAAVALLPWPAFAQEETSLVPQPQTMVRTGGQYTPDNRATVTYEADSLAPVARYLCDVLGRQGITADARPGRNGTYTIRASGRGTSGSYALDVEKEGVRIVAADCAGAACAVASLHQLFDADGKRTPIDCLHIDDTPRYPWRGLMVDCSRHFFSTDEMLQIVDLMALYKLNRLHWHLTDDQGWRIEIKRYPLLTQRGAWRTMNRQDEWCETTARKNSDPDLRLDRSKMQPAANATDSLYGGFYTQDDVRRVVAYASARGIDVVPEIDMPGHSLGAIACYPQLGCRYEGEGEAWRGSFSSPLCLGRDATLEFCRNVWSELFDLFPSKYAHIGGDEVEMSFWNECPDCRKRIDELQITNGGKGLQAWFTREMEQFFNVHGRRMIGWDEILAGGVSHDATVMWWRGDNAQGAVDAANGGNDVVCCPTTHFYYDFAQNDGDLERIFLFAPPAGIDASAQNRVIGLQGNLWAEHVPSMRRLCYMVLPRLIAQAEAAWTPTAARTSWADFDRRMQQQYARLRSMGMAYRLPDITGVYGVNAYEGSTTVEARCADPSAVIRFTTDSTAPTAASPVLPEHYTIDSPATLTLRAFAPGDLKGEPVTVSYEPAQWIEPAQTAAPAEKGFTARWYDYAGELCGDIDKAPFLGTYHTDEVCIPEGVKGNIGLIIDGFFHAPADGFYAFILSSDDGSTLSLDGEMVIDNDGGHSTVVKSRLLPLRKGYHPMQVKYFDHNGGGLFLKSEKVDR